MLLELAVWFVVSVALYQAIDIYQRRTIDGIDSYRAWQAGHLKIRYESCLKNVDRMMQHMTRTERQLNDLSAQSFATAGQIEEMVEKFNQSVEELNSQMREEFFIRKAMVRLPDDKG